MKNLIRYCSSTLRHLVLLICVPVSIRPTVHQCKRLVSLCVTPVESTSGATLSLVENIDLEFAEEVQVTLLQPQSVLDLFKASTILADHIVMV